MGRGITVIMDPKIPPPLLFPLLLLLGKVGRGPPSPGLGRGTTGMCPPPLLLLGKVGRGPPSPGLGRGITGVPPSSGAISGVPLKSGRGPPSPGFGSGVTGKLSSPAIAV